MKVWEETWQVQLDESKTHQNLVVDRDGSGVIVAQGCGGSDEDDARAHLAAAAPDMARVLLAVQDLVKDPDRTAGSWHEHIRDTLVEMLPIIDAALKKAGVR